MPGGEEKRGKEKSREEKKGGEIALNNALELLLYYKVQDLHLSLRGN